MSRLRSLNFEFKNPSIAISMFLDDEILESIKKLSNLYSSFLLEKFTKSTACPMTDTFFDFIGNEVIEAVTIFSEIIKLKKSMNFLIPNFGPGCVNQSVDLILFFFK